MSEVGRLMNRSLRCALLLPFVAAPFARAEVLAVSPANFQAPWTNPYRYGTLFEPGQGMRTSNDWASCAVAPTQLPNGASIDSLVMVAVDDDPTANLVATLLRIGNTGTAAVEVAEAASSGDSSSIRTFLAFPPADVDRVVDDATESWWVRVCYDDSLALELHHVYVTYQGRPAGVDTTSPVVVPASAFRGSGVNDVDAQGAAFSFHHTRGYAIASDLAGDSCPVAPVYLPAGATIETLSADLLDNSTYNLGIQLRRKRLSTSEASQLLAEVTTTGASSAVVRRSSSAISNAVVDDRYQYFLSTISGCLREDEDLRIYSVRIDHDDPIFSDGFESGNQNRWEGRPAAVLVIPPAEMISAPYDYTGKAEVDPTTGILALDDYCAIAPVHLPHGSESFLLESYLRDSDASRNLTLSLRRKRATTTAVTLLSAVTTSGSSANQQYDLAVLSEVVDNDSYHYYVDACAPDGAPAGLFSIHGVKVSYYLP